MKVEIQHEKYGNVLYEEGFWLGRKSVSINGAPLQKIARNQFQMTDENGEIVTVMTKGNYIYGSSLYINGEKIVTTPTIKWYEYILPILTFVFTLIWSNIPQCVLIFPIVGGAIGGGVSAIILMAGMFVSRLMKTTPLKLIITITFCALTILALYLIGLLVLQIML
ncbi:MAG: hypothetical protein IKM44_00565 [Clostridia bacterium]|nr:hypothetical protein [Clostridia bacterium]